MSQSVSEAGLDIREEYEAMLGKVLETAEKYVEVEDVEVEPIEVDELTEKQREVIENIGQHTDISTAEALRANNLESDQEFRGVISFEIGGEDRYGELKLTSSGYRAHTEIGVYEQNPGQDVVVQSISDEDRTKIENMADSLQEKDPVEGAEIINRR